MFLHFLYAFLQMQVITLTRDSPPSANNTL